MNAEHRILVTGSAGFIGSNLLRRLKDSDVSVVGLDNYSSYYSRSMKLARELDLGISELTVEADISNLNALRDIFIQVKPTIVINLAAQGGVRSSRIDPLPYIVSNQLGFLNLLELSKEFGVSKFIYASSSSVYGDATTAPFQEFSKLPAPKSLYALSKLSNEIIAENFTSPEMEKIGLRFFTVYGPWGRPDMAMFRILASSILEKDFILTASRDVARDFTFVDDLVEVIQHIAEREILASGHQVINVAGGKPYSLSQLFTILEDLGFPLRIIQSYQDSLDVKLTHGSVQKLKNLGLPIPSLPLSRGVEITANWIRGIEKKTLTEWFDYSA